MAKKRSTPKGKVRTDFYLRKDNKTFLTKASERLDVTESRVLDLIIDRAKQNTELLKLL